MILTARLTRLYERRDWRDRLAEASDLEPLRLELGIALDLKPVLPLAPIPAVDTGPDRALLERAHRRVMDLLEQRTPGGASPFIDLAQMRQARQARLESMERE